MPRPSRLRPSPVPSDTARRLPRSSPLAETGPFYTDVQPGDIVYYNPLDSITIIYEETSSVPTLTEMGEIISDLSVFDDLPDDVTMTIGVA